MALTLSGTNGVVGAGFTVDASGVSVTAGVGTFSSIGAGASVPAAGLTGSLPTISAANCTNIPAANITGTLPAISGANLTGIAAGITMADEWRLHTTYNVPNASDTYITSNWERADSDGFGQLGTGMTESSGEFTFPSTGIYLIFWHVELYASSSALTRGMNRIYTTTDGSSYGWASNANVSLYTSGAYSNVNTVFQFDVTNTSTHKVKFLVYYEGSGVQMLGSTNTNQTTATFIRLGDT